MPAIYLDNAATSFPKPPAVAEAMVRYMTEVGASINRGVYGSAQAARWIRQWLCDHPRQRIPAAMPSNLSGNYSGKFLQAMGFSFFDPSRSYHLEPKAQLGLMEAHAWCDEDGPDEDGFGREEYYDWWLLDEFLQEIPGVPMVACCSHREWRDSIGVFRNQWDAAVAALKARNGSPQ